MNPPCHTFILNRSYLHSGMVLYQANLFIVQILMLESEEYREQRETRPAPDAAPWQLSSSGQSWSNSDILDRRRGDIGNRLPGMGATKQH